MVDTVRTLADLQTLLADNATGDISAQDIRDFLVSVMSENLEPFKRTQEEINAGITPTDYNYPPGNVKRYGALGDGVADDLQAFDDAFAATESTRNAWTGNMITIPFGDYILSDTWHIDRQVHIRGAGSGDRSDAAATNLTFPADTTGIRFHSSVEVGFENSAYSSISDISIFCSDTQITGHGLHTSATLFMTRVMVRSFAENGFNIVASSGGGTGNANLWSAKDIQAIDNAGHGLFVQGDDTNTGECIGGNFKNNGGWQIWDDSFLGNTYYGCHIAAGAGAIGTVKSGPSFTSNIWMNIYVEAAGSYVREMTNPAMVIGGGLSATPDAPTMSITGDGSGAVARYLQGSYVQVVNRGSGYTTASASIDNHGSGSGATFTVNLDNGEVDSVTVDTPGSGYEGNATRIAFLNHFGSVGGFQTGTLRCEIRNDAVRPGQVRIGDGQAEMITCRMNDIAGNFSLMRWDEGRQSFNTAGGTDSKAFVGVRYVSIDSPLNTGGRSAQLNNSMPMFPNGLWLDDQSAGRNINAKAAMPTGGENAEGDFVFNTNPAPLPANQDVLIGWKRLVTGTNHVLDTDWVACYAKTTATVTATTTALEDITDAINTTSKKVEGQQIFNITTGAPVWAAGNADGDVWVDATGTTAHTPV